MKGRKWLGTDASRLTLLPSSAVILQEDGNPTELSSADILAPEDKAILLGFVREQKLTKGFLSTGVSGRVFVIPDGGQSLLLAGGERSIIGDPSGPDWDLGILAPGETTQISLLFEVPAGASELAWQFLGSTPVGLSESQTSSLSGEPGSGLTLGLTNDELCQVAERLDLEYP